MIHELASSKIMPAIRGILAHKLRDIGISQRKIALYLEVTQPMISKILKKPISEYYLELEALKISREIVDHYVDILLNLVRENNYEKYISTSYYVVNNLAMKAICNIKPNLARLCTTGEYRDPDIEYYRSLLSRLLSIPGLERLIPEVGSNLVYAPAKPDSISDIIGLTGRVVRANAGVVYYGEPIYGGSRHVAKVLLLASKINPSVRFCFNIKCDTRVRSVLSVIEPAVVDTGPSRDIDEFWLNIERAIYEHQPKVICDHGGMGLEPNTYILASRYEELEEFLKAVIGELSKQ